MSHLESHTDRALHAADIESLERKIMDLALERTGARHGALFLVGEDENLHMDFHVVEGVAVSLPNIVLRRRHDGRPNGIAFEVADRNEPYLAEDTSEDPSYAPYFLDVRSIAAVPIRYQDRAIGVLSVSAREPRVFTSIHLDELMALASSSAKFLRRAQLFRGRTRGQGRELLIKGLSPEWLEVERVIERVAPTSAPVLVRGESGTGKELAAHSLHFNSTRRKKPFVTVNCAAIPETLLESTLFGHVRGAFTGAMVPKIGEFEKADGGTLFLDELGELAPSLQAKLLRAVEDGEILALGSNAAAQRVDVRVIGATNRDLERMMSQGTFRSDLYYRMSVVTLELPPLRKFKHNIPILANVFLHQARERYGRPVERISSDAVTALMSYDYPGNMRELKNIIDYAVLMAPGKELERKDLPRSVVRAPSEPLLQKKSASLRDLRRQWILESERRYLQETIERAPSIREAARLVGVSPASFYRLLRQHRLKLHVRAEAEDE